MAAQITGGITQTRALAQALNPLSLGGFVFQDSGRTLVALLNRDVCDGECAPRRVIVRSAEQLEFAGLPDHDRAEIRTVLAEHAARINANLQQIGGKVPA